MTNGKQLDASVTAYRQRMDIAVARLKGDLKKWIARHQGADVFDDPESNIPNGQNSTEVTAALLETAMDRQINLHGEKDARELILSAFDRRAKALRQRLH